MELGPHSPRRAKISSASRRTSWIDFLLEDAKTPNGSPFATDVDELALRGVEFRVCRFTLERRNIEPAKVISDAKIVPSGVAEVARLQALEH